MKADLHIIPESVLTATCMACLMPCTHTVHQVEDRGNIRRLCSRCCPICEEKSA